MSSKTLLTTGLASIVVAAALGVASQFPAAFGSAVSTAMNSEAPDEIDLTGSGVERPLVEFVAEVSASDDPFAATTTESSVFGGGPGNAISQYAGFSSSAKRKSAARIREVLSQECPPLEFPGEVPLSEILQSIGEYVENQKALTLNILPDYAELEMDGVSSLDEITVMDVALAGDVTLHSALELIFAQTSDPQLDYVIKDEVMLITTRTAAEFDEYMETRVYDVRRILPLFHEKIVQQPIQQVPAVNGGFGGGGGFGSVGLFQIADGSASPKKKKAGSAGGGRSAQGTVQRKVGPAEQLVEMIESITAPPARWYNTDGEGGRMTATETHLVVRQSRRGHELVVDVLEQLQELVASSEN